MITFVKLVCPNCGANLEVDSKLSQCFCQYCGTKILLHNENEHTLNVNINRTDRFIDEAGLAEQENERRKIEFEQKKYEDKKQKQETAEKNFGRTIGRLALFYLGFFLCIPTVALLGSAFIGILDGGPIEIVLSIICILDFILMLYSYISLFRKTQLKPKYGVAGLIVSLVVCVLLMRHMIGFLNSLR